MSQSHEENGRRSAPSTPRWVKIFVIVVIALFVLLVIIMLINPGDHGPGRHQPTGGLGDYSLVTEMSS